jgi:addiction module HigA family antidote
MKRENIHNPHPGEIIQHHFLDELNMEANELSRLIGIPRSELSKILNAKKGITAETDLLLCRFFELSEGYFLRLQNAYDTLEAKRKPKVYAKLREIQPLDRATVGGKSILTH